MTKRTVGTRWRRGLGLLGVMAVMLLTACAAKKPRKTCGLSRTNDGLRRWYAKYESNPKLLGDTVERMLSTATAAVTKGLAAGGIDTRPNPANGGLALRTAQCHLQVGDWDRGLRYLYLALAVLPRTPAHRQQRTTIVLHLAQALYELKAYRASALYAMHYRKQPLATRAGKADATALLSKLHAKLLWSDYRATYGAAISGLPLAKAFGVGQRRTRRADDRFGERLGRYERDPRLLGRAVERRLRRGMAKVAGRRCVGGTPELRLARAKGLYRALRLAYGSQQWRKTIRGLLLLLACLPQEARFDRIRLNAVYLLARSHEELHEYRVSALYYLYFLVHAGNADEHRRARKEALTRYRARRAGLGLTGRLALPTDGGKLGVGTRCPLPTPR